MDRQSSILPASRILTDHTTGSAAWPAAQRASAPPAERSKAKDLSKRDAAVQASIPDAGLSQERSPRRANLSRATARRFLLTLAELGYVRAESSTSP
jgi:hypothetical protein